METNNKHTPTILLVEVFRTSCHITDEYGNTMCELYFAHYESKAECLKQANEIVTACNSYEALKQQNDELIEQTTKLQADNTLLKEVNEAQAFTIDKYKADKDRLAELVKQYLSDKLDAEKYYAERSMVQDAKRCQSEANIIKQTLSKCGY